MTTRMGLNKIVVSLRNCTDLAHNKDTGPTEEVLANIFGFFSHSEVCVKVIITRTNSYTIIMKQ